LHKELWGLYFPKKQQLTHRLWPLNSQDLNPVVICMGHKSRMYVINPHFLQGLKDNLHREIAGI